MVALSHFKRIPGPLDREDLQGGMTTHNASETTRTDINTYSDRVIAQVHDLSIFIDKNERKAQ